MIAETAGAKKIATRHIMNTKGHFKIRYALKYGYIRGHFKLFWSCLEGFARRIVPDQFGKYANSFVWFTNSNQTFIAREYKKKVL